MQFFILRDAERRDRCLSFLRALNLSSLWSVKIEPYKPKRSDAQNRLYWAYINAIADQLDYDAEALHWLLKKNFLGFEVIEVLGEKVIMPRSSTGLKVKEFADYLRKIEIFAGEKGLMLPNPDDRRYALNEPQSAPVVPSTVVQPPKNPALADRGTSYTEQAKQMESVR
jgi:hypothetical protein